MSSNIAMIDASTYQKLIARLSETMAQKVLREGQKQILAPATFHPDIFISIGRHRTPTTSFTGFIAMTCAPALAGKIHTQSPANRLSGT
jgi:hypothetical protein